MIPRDRIRDILTALGLHGDRDRNGGDWQVEIPPHRYQDLEREIDLIEEVARLYGYNHFANTLPQARWEAIFPQRPHFLNGYERPCGGRD
jgi:phenylalanyl-tRNA synthetase beta chain